MPNFTFQNQNTAAAEQVGMLGRYGFGNYFVVTADFSSATWNTVATHETHIVTGAVRMMIIPEVKTTVTTAAAGTLSFGVETAGTSLIAATAVAQLVAPSLFLATTNVGGAIRMYPDGANNGPLDIMVVGGLDLGVGVATGALTAGRVDFHTWWIPLDINGAVQPGLGGTL